jgi:transposase
VSASFAVKLLQRVSRLKTARPARQGRPPGSRLDGHGAFLVAQVQASPDITMPELAARLTETSGVKAAPAVLSRFLCRLGFTYKKSADGVGMRSRRHP